MKISCLLFCLTLISFSTLSQSSARVDKLLAKQHQLLDKLEIENSSTITLLPSKFSEDHLAFSNQRNRVEELTIVKVYYVFTRYRQSASFNQQALNERRFSELQTNFPAIISDPFIEWEIIEQTGCDSPEEGRTFFHGFVLVHRPEPTSSEYESENERLKAYLDNPTNEFSELELDKVKSQLNPTAEKEEVKDLVIEKPLSNVARYKEGNKALLNALKNSFASNEQIVTKRTDKWVNVQFTITKDSVLQNIQFDPNTPQNLQEIVEATLLNLDKWIPEKELGEDKDTKLAMEIRVSYSREVSGMYTINGNRPVFEKEPEVVLEIPKPDNSYIELQKTLLNASTVYKGLEQLDAKQRFALVMDVTGSMSGNIAAMKRWIELRNDSLEFTSFSFFNDGDGKATRFKKIGRTGGIYTTQSQKEINNTIEFAKDKGSGGERSESDFEAVIHAQTNDSSCTAIVLIADNYSEVRDVELMNQIHIPVHILICAAPNGVREEYVNLARYSKGKIIYYGEVINVNAISSGEVLHIGPASYSFNGKAFKLIEKDK